MLFFLLFIIISIIPVRRTDNASSFTINYKKMNHAPLTVTVSNAHEKTTGIYSNPFFWKSCDQTNTPPSDKRSCSNLCLHTTGAARVKTHFFSRFSAPTARQYETLCICSYANARRRVWRSTRYPLDVHDLSSFETDPFLRY